MRKFNWPTVIGATVTVATIAVIALFGAQLGIPLEIARGALAFLGALGTLVMGAMRSYLQRDENHNQIPDWMEEDR